jgi:arabinogalactan endo-1,4-beta-galactosidase
MDVERSIARAKANGMKVLLDFHYADTWADPGKQHVPSAWIDITSIDVLRDSVYNYTLKTFQYLNSKNLTPDFVQLGNETNCGLLYTDAPQAFPSCYVCNGEWSNLGKVINAGIQAVKDATADVPIKTKIILHVADPRHVDWWFSGIKNNAMVTDFDVIGFSYYPLWHTGVKIGDISAKITEFKTKFSKEVMIMETAYPWTTAGDDDYNNLFGGDAPIGGYSYTEQGQLELMKKLTKEVKDGKGLGLIYWEPAWISSSMKDLWGTGSSWENCTFFDFDGNTLDIMTYAKLEY